MNKPRVSVVLAVYNGEKFLAEAIQSIIDQTFHDFELVIVNDGSTDHSEQVINSFTDPRIKKLNQPNLGLAPALNAGAAISEGEYLARMDADDIAMPGRLQSQVDFLDERKDVSVVSSGAIYIDENGCTLGRSFPVTSKAAINKMMLTRGCVIMHPAVMMRKADFLKVGGYTESIGTKFTDYHLWVKFINKGYSVLNMAEPLLKYRITESASTSSYILSKEAHTLLLELVATEDPSPEKVSKLYGLLEPASKGDTKRVEEITDSQNRLFQFLRIFGEKRATSIISGLKNLVTIIR